MWDPRSGPVKSTLIDDRAELLQIARDQEYAFVKRYRLPQPIRDAYRDRDLIQPRLRPYSEIERDLDAVAAMPEAAVPEMQDLLARERLRLLHYCGASDQEIERVLQSHAATLAVMPAFERLWTLRNITWGHPELAERYLTPMLAEVTNAIERDMIESALSVVRGESQVRGYEREAAWDHDFGLAIAHSEVESESDRLASEELLRGIRYTRRLQQLGWPYEEVLGALDELSARPEAAGFSSWIASDRLTVADMYQRPAEDMEEQIQRAMTVFQGQPIKEWAHIISSACSKYPTLAEKYLPPLIAELAEELRGRPDPEGEEMREYLEEDLELARSITDE